MALARANPSTFSRRVRSITSLIEEINTARATLYGELAKKTAESEDEQSK